MTLLITTLNDLLQERKGKRDRPTIELLEFNRRVAKEIIEASDQRRLLEYLGMRVGARKEIPSDTMAKARI